MQRLLVKHGVLLQRGAKADARPDLEHGIASDGLARTLAELVACSHLRMVGRHEVLRTVVR